MTTWMLLEDEPDLYDMVLAMYGMLGIRGVAFDSGEDAFSWLARVDDGQYPDELPQLALLDIRLPDSISGPMVSARIRQSPALRNIVVVLMTAYRLSREEEAAIMRESGADFLIRKPLPKLNELEAKLKSLIAKRANSLHS